MDRRGRWSDAARSTPTPAPPAASGGYRTRAGEVQRERLNAAALQGEVDVEVLAGRGVRRPSLVAGAGGEKRSVGPRRSAGGRVQGPAGPTTTEAAR